MSFVFLDPGELDESAIRRQVRSRAAAYSHRVGPRKAKSSKKRSESSKADGARVSKRGSSRQTALSIRPSTASASGILTSNDSAQSKDVSLRARSSACMWPSTRGPSPCDWAVGVAVEDPFGTSTSFPVPRQWWFGPLLQHFPEFLKRGWRGLPVTPSEVNSALSWVQHMTRSHPSYFYMNILSLQRALLEHHPSGKQMALWITPHLVATINAALRKPKAELDTGLVMTIGRIALHEIMGGDAEVGVKFHWPAFAKMIVLAGGVKAFNLPPLVAKHWAWAERIVRQKTGVSIIDLEPSLADEPIFHRARQLENDLEALRGYFPRRQFHDAVLEDGTHKIQILQTSPVDDAAVPPEFLRPRILVEESDEVPG